MKLFFLVLAFLVLALPSKVYAGVFCVDAEKIYNQVESCEENDAYVDQAEKCLERLEDSIMAEKAKMKFSADKNKNQSKNFGTAVADYGLSETTLNKLIAQAQQATSELEMYPGLVVLPEDSDEPEMNGGDEEAFANSVPCFGETQKSIESVLKDMDDITNELKAAKTASTDLKNANSANKGTVDSANPNAASDLNMQSQGQTTGATPAAKSRGSSISGKITDGKSKKVDSQKK